MKSRRTLTVNTNEHVLAQIQGHVTRFSPFLTQHRVAAAALKLGLDVLDRDPDLLVRLLTREGDAS